MDKQGSGGIQQQLKSGGSSSATIASGGNATFQFNDLLDRAPTGFLALYLTALFMTFSFTLTQAGGTGVAIPRDRFPGLLIDSIDWSQSWLGSPAPKSVFAGSRLDLIEFVSNGFMYGQRHQNQMPAANGARQTSFTVRVPALNDRRGQLVRDTSQLALLFQPSQLKVTMAPLATLTAFSPGATLSTFTVTLTAQLEPRQELVFGTPMEWILHTPVAGGPQVTIQGFGRDTALNGFKPKGGVAFAGDLGLLNGMGGVVVPSSVTDFQWQWRGQPTITDIKAYVLQFYDLMPSERAMVSGGVDAGSAGANDFSGFPNSTFAGPNNTANPDTDNLLFFPLAMGGDYLHLTDLQTAESDQTFNMNQTGGFVVNGPNHLILAQYARIPERDKVLDWISQVTRGGDSSLASYVLQGSANVQKALAYANTFADGLGRRRPNDKHVVTPDMDTYLARQLVVPS